MNVGVWVGLGVSPPHRLHHAQAHCVVMVTDSDRGELVGDFTCVGLYPGYQGFVSLQLGYHVFGIGGRRIGPRNPTLDHMVVFHVVDSHGAQRAFCRGV